MLFIRCNRFELELRLKKKIGVQNNNSIKNVYYKYFRIMFEWKIED